MNAINVNHRTHLENLQQHEIFLLRGIDENDPGLCVMGWAEEAVHAEEGTAAVLNEPIFCFVQAVAPPVSGSTTSPNPSLNNSGVYQSVQLIFQAPEHHVPLKAEFFEYTRIESYEAKTALGAAYFNQLASLRGTNIRYYVTCAMPKQTRQAPAKQIPAQPHQTR